MDKLLVLFQLVVMSSEFSHQLNDGDHVVTFSAQRDNYCGNNSMCPTWFICTPQKICQCGEGYNDAVVCSVKKNSFQLSWVEIV